MTFKRVALILSTAAIATALNPQRSHEGRLDAQGTTRTLRPTSGTSGTFAGLANAYDGNPYTASSLVKSAICSATCTTLQSGSAIWSGIEDGHHPLILNVYWYAQASAFYAAPAAPETTATIQYSLDSGATWRTLESAVWTASSPACSNHGITCSDHVASLSLDDYQHTGAIQVRAYLGVRMSACWSCGWFGFDNVSGQIIVVDIEVVADDCDTPIDESSASLGWNSTTGLRTAHDFEMTLTPLNNTISFANRNVLEADGGDTYDSCWYDGAGRDPVTDVVSGGNWPVDSNNLWETDTVGWGESEANFYQGTGHHPNGLPCGVGGHQQMFISCQSSTQHVPYIRNWLEYTIDADTVSSQRQSNYQSKTWP